MCEYCFISSAFEIKFLPHIGTIDAYTIKRAIKWLAKAKTNKHQ